jgi:hypothetical protein
MAGQALGIVTHFLLSQPKPRPEPGEEPDCEMNVGIGI